MKLRDWVALVVWMLVGVLIFGGGFALGFLMGHVR